MTWFEYQIVSIRKLESLDEWIAEHYDHEGKIELISTKKEYNQIMIDAVDYLNYLGERQWEIVSQTNDQWTLQKKVES